MQADQHFSVDQGSDRTVLMNVKDALGQPRNVSGETRTWIVAEGRDRRAIRYLTKTPTTTDGDGTGDQCVVTLDAEDTRPLDPGIYWHELRIGDNAEIGGNLTINGSVSG